MKKLLSVMAIFLVAAFVAFPPAAQAVGTLTLSDGTTTVTVVDESTLDAYTGLGTVTYLGAVGTNWYLNVTTGASLDIGSTKIDLNSIDGSRGTGTLTLTYTDSGFTLPALQQMAMHIGGTIGSGTQGIVTYSAYYNGNNPIGTLGPFTGGAFAGSFASNISPANTFSLTQIVQLTHESLGTTSFNAALDFIPVPVPASVLLLGTGLVGLVGLRYRSKRQG